MENLLQIIIPFEMFFFCCPYFFNNLCINKCCYCICLSQLRTLYYGQWHYSKVFGDQVWWVPATEEEIERYGVPDPGAMARVSSVVHDTVAESEFGLFAGIAIGIVIGVAITLYLLTAM